MTSRARGVHAIGAGLALACAAACSSGSDGVGDDAPLEAGQHAPAYAAKTVVGGAASLASLRGKVVLLNAWATWCAPCRAEIPLIRAFHTRYAGQGLEVVGVSLDESDGGAAIGAFVKQYDMRYRIWRDPARRFLTDFRFDGLPMTVLVDRAGVIRWIWTGKLEARDTTLDAAIRKSLVTSQ